MQDKIKLSELWVGPIAKSLDLFSLLLAVCFKLSHAKKKQPKNQKNQKKNQTKNKKKPKNRMFLLWWMFYLTLNQISKYQEIWTWPILRLIAGLNQNMFAISLFFSLFLFLFFSSSKYHNNKCFFFVFEIDFFVSFEGGIQPQKIDSLYLLKAEFNLRKLDGTISHWQQLMETEFTWQEKIIDPWNAYGLTTQQSRLLFLNSSLYYTFEVQLFDLSQAIATLWYLFAFCFFFSSSFLLFFSSPRFFSLWNENASIWSSK